MTSIAQQMRADLVVALKAGDGVRVSALRVGLAAVANAEAVDPAGPTTAAGLRDDVARRTLDEDDVVVVLAAERDDLRDQAAALRARGRAEADDLDDRAAVLAAYLPAAGAAPTATQAVAAATDAAATDEPAGPSRSEVVTPIRQEVP